MSTLTWPTPNSTRELRRLKEEKLRRLELQMRAQRQRKEQAEWERCAGDVVYWLNTYGLTYDPRLPDPVLPFHLFPLQTQFLRWLEAREAAQEGGLVEKSRDMGVTWLCAAFALHRWLFRPGYALGFGSRKLTYVDDKDNLDTIFEKIRFLLKDLPAWMVPADFRWNLHSTLGKLINPANGASITGEGGDNIGRGGRKSLYFVDEAAFVEHAEMIERSLASNTNVRIDVSTPNGMGNPFYRKRFGGNVPVFTLHWKDDPRKNTPETQTFPDGKQITTYPWAEAQRRRLDYDDTAFAQEIDIDYAASLPGVCIPARYVQAGVGLIDSPEFQAAYPQFKLNGSLVAGFDIGGEGGAKSVLTLRRSIAILELIAWSGLDTTQGAWRAREEAIARDV